MSDYRTLLRRDDLHDEPPHLPKFYASLKERFRQDFRLKIEGYRFVIDRIGKRLKKKTAVARYASDAWRRSRLVTWAPLLGSELKSAWEKPRQTAHGGGLNY